MNTKQEYMNTIICGDCFDILHELTPASVDLILTDPPYGTTAISWDQGLSEAELQQMWSLFQRVLVPNGAAVVCAAGLFGHQLAVTNPKQFKYNLVWKKTMSVGFLNASRRPLILHEDILVFADSLGQMTFNPQFGTGKRYRIVRNSNQANTIYRKYQQHETVNTGSRCPVSVLEFPNPGKHTYHPTEKPLELIQYLVLTYSNEGDVVLDPFAGSGTTCVAAKATGRQFIGIEKDQAYVGTANQRLLQEYLF